MHKGQTMKHVESEFNFIDALLLYCAAYCRLHGYRATLGHILLTADAVNRSMPMAFELEIGFGKLIAGGYVEYAEELFLVTDLGMKLFNDATRHQSPKATALEQIRDLVAMLNKSHLKAMPSRLAITGVQYSAAIKEAREIFDEVRARMDASRKIVKTD